MGFEDFAFGLIRIDSVTHEHDVESIMGTSARGRKKRRRNSVTPSVMHHSVKEEEIPWKCRCLVIGTGAYGRLPVMDEVRREAARREIKLLILPTAQAIEALQQDSDKTNAILHVTC